MGDDMKSHESEWFTSSSGSSKRNIRDSSDNSGAHQNVGVTYPKKILQQIAMVCQIVLGVTVITLSLMGLIRPLWLSTFLTMLGSLTVLAGAGYIYLNRNKQNDPNALLRSAMRRVMESQN
jgi:hypothetical protein